MRIPENLYMLLPKYLKMRAIKHTMALIADSIGGTKCATMRGRRGNLKSGTPIDVSTIATSSDIINLQQKDSIERLQNECSHAIDP